jgi:hypothetical protein
MQKNLLLLLTSLFLSASSPLLAQKWGYVTLIAKSNTNSVSLIDTNNQVVKQWTNLSGNTSYSSYLMPGGILWRTIKATGTSFSGGGICGRVQKVDWNGNILFDYSINTTDKCSHHDICPLPNGNVMLIVYERKTAAEVQAAGGTPNAVRWSEAIYELQPTGTNTANIVWEWHLWDHLVQNLYPTKANYQTSVLDHPELLNINYNNNMTDWVHMNGIDYNAELNQVVVSSHFLNELWVIDHSTTSAQAATHSGGNSGKGGDFLYRWGNPAAYGATGSAVFKVVHDAHWVPEDCPRAGWLAGFNNQGVSNTNSAVDMFNPPRDGYNYTRTQGQAYQPSTYGYRHAANGYSSNMGNSQQLPNGNMLVCLATASKVYEIDSNGNQIWQYVSNGGIPQAWRHTRCYLENPVASAAIPDAVCTGANVQLDVTATATAVNSFSYQWSPSTGLSDPNVRNPVVSGLSDSLVYTVTVSTPGGCSATATVPVAVLPAPIADAGADVTIEAGQSTTLSANGGSAYLWSNAANTASIVVSPAATTTFTVTVIDDNGCGALDDVTVSVIPALNVTASAANNSFCVGGNTSLQALATEGTGTYSYSWSSVPAGFSSNLSNPTVNPTQSTVYQVVVADGLASDTAWVALTVNPLPVAEAGPNQMVAFGVPATLNASGGDIYLWSNGATTASIEVSPGVTTTYTVTVTNASGCSSTDEVTITITGTALSTVTSANPAFMCAGASAQLSTVVSGGTGNYSYEWRAEGNPISTAANLSVSPAQSTWYFVSINDGFSALLDSVLLNVVPLPVVNAGNDEDIFVGGSVTLSATGGAVYEWNTGETLAAITVSPITTTTYTVTATDANGCQNTDEVQVNVSNPPLQVNVSASSTSICALQSVQLNALVSGGSGQYSYQWSSNPPGFVSTEANPIVSPTLTTTYQLEVSDGSESIGAIVEIVVYPVPMVDAGADQTILTGEAVTLNANGADIYLWSTGASGASINVMPTETTTYTVVGTNSNGCSSSDQVVVTVEFLDPFQASIHATNTVICTGEITQLFATPTGGTGSYSYNWASEPVGFSSTLPDPFINPESTTQYFVTVSDGTSNLILNIVVVVNPLPQQPVISLVGNTLVSSSATNNQWFLYGSPVPDATGQEFIPTLDGSYQVQVVDGNGCYSLLSDPIEVIASGTEEAMQALHCTVSPNPANQKVMLLGDFDAGNCRINIWNAAGIMALQTENTRELQIGGLPSGTYFIRISAAEGITTRKLIIQH